MFLWCCRHVCNINTVVSVVHLTERKGIWTEQANVTSTTHVAAHWPEVVLVCFYQKWIEPCFCRVRWRKRNILWASFTRSEFARCHSWLDLVPWRAEGEVRALTIATACPSDPETEGEAHVHYSEVQQGFCFYSWSCKSPFRALLESQSSPYITFITWPEFLCLLFGEYLSLLYKIGSSKGKIAWEERRQTAIYDHARKSNKKNLSELQKVTSL